MQNLSLSVESFGGVESVALDLAPGINLLVGPNGAGKTTLLRAASACARMGAIIPIINKDGKDALLKKESHLMVRGTSGFASLTGDQGSRQVAWPSNAHKGTGPFADNPPSRMALGMIDWMSTSMAARIQMMIEAANRDPALSTKIDRTDLDQAVANHNVDQDKVDWVWKVITSDGRWDVANKETSKLMTEATGAWKATTKESFGTEKAKNYRPKGWDEHLATATQEELQSAILEATQRVEKAISNKAVDAAELARLKHIACKEMPDISSAEHAVSAAKKLNVAEISTLQSSLTELHNEPSNITEAKGTIAEAKKRIMDLQNQVEAMLAGAPRVDGHCPGCSIPLVLTDRSVSNGPQRYVLTHSTGTQVDQTQINALNRDIETMQTRISKETGIINKHAKRVVNKKGIIQNELEGKQVEQRQAYLVAKTRLTNATQQADEIKTAQVQLATITAKEEGVSANVLVILRQEKAQAEARMNAWLIKTNADRYAEDARQFSVLKGVTAPGGLRKTKMDQSLAGFNKRLAWISDYGKWGTVSLSNDFDLQYMGRPYVVCSGAEQYRCQATLQVFMATLEKAPLMLFDGADILDSKGRMGLVNMLVGAGIQSVIAMTGKLDYAKAVTKLIDATFWVEGGAVRRIPKPTAPAPQLPPEPPPEDPELTKYKEMLARHDWLYAMADDGRAYRDGEKAHNHLISRARQGGDDYKNAFNLAYAKAWNRVNPDPVTPIFQGK